MGRKSTLFFLTMLLICIAATGSCFKAHGQRIMADEGHIWLEASPKTYETNSYTQFNVAVMVRNVSQDDNLLGVQFAVKYNPTLLELINITEGPFLKQWAPYGTFAGFVYPNGAGLATYGEIILPNSKGVWDMTAMPQGEGVVAVLTFQPLFVLKIGTTPLQFNITLQPIAGEMFIDKSGEWIPYETPIGGLYTYTFNYQSKPLPGDGEVLFEAPEFPTVTPTFTWDFGDGAQVTTNDSTIVHAFTQPRSYNVILSTYIQELNVTLQMSKTVKISSPAQPINVKVDTGSLYFRGEEADFNIVVADNTQTVNAHNVTALLYKEGVIKADLTDSIVQLGTGLYEVRYTIPGDAQPGTYTLIVQAQTYAYSDTALRSFEISQTIAGMVSDVHNGFLTVSNVELNVAAINATITGLITNGNGQILAKIDTTLGPLTATLDSINATVTRVDGNTATLSTSLGDVKVNVDYLRANSSTGTQSTTIMLLAVAILSAIAIVLAMVFATSARKK
jgi:PKD repeat protein